MLDPDSVKHVSGTREEILNNIREKLNLTDKIQNQTGKVECVTACNLRTIWL